MSSVRQGRGMKLEMLRMCLRSVKEMTRVEKWTQPSFASRLAENHGGDHFC